MLVLGRVSHGKQRKKEDMSTIYTVYTVVKPSHINDLQKQEVMTVECNFSNS